MRISPFIFDRARLLMTTSVAAAALLTAAATASAAPETATPTASPVQVDGLATDYAHDPLGIDVAAPQLSWKLKSPARGELQTAYQVLVSSSESNLAQSRGDVWDSGKMASGQSVDIRYGGAPLASQTRYYWKVRVWGGNGEPSTWSAPAWWETALLQQSDWTAKWIGPSTFGTNPAAGPLLRKEFTTDRPISRARVYVSGLGNYVLSINGKRVGNRVLDPAYTEYDKTDLYSTYDATSYLQSGQNAIGAELAPGFYYSSTPKLLMQLVIDYADGSSTTIATDGSWQLDTSGPTLFDTSDGLSGGPVFAGETYDARRDPTGWDQPGFNAQDWQPASIVPAPGGKLVAGAAEPVTVGASVEPVGVAEPQAGTYVVDMGRTLTGWVRLTASGQAGAKVSIQYGEKLNSDGTVNATPSPGPRPRYQRDEYIFRGSGTETWEPSFTWKSFRYVQLNGLSAPPQNGAVIGRVVHNAVQNEGEFSSSDTLYNEIHQAMRSTTLNALLGYPAIDPANERNGWTADTHLITPSMTDNFGVDAFLRQWLNDIQDSQRSDGVISKIDPIRDGCCYGGWTPEWTAAYPLVAWDLYVRYGDRDVLESHYDSLVNYMQWQIRSLSNGIAPASQFGDWYSPGYGAGPEDRRLTATAYVYREAMVMADIASALGHNDNAADYRSTAQSINTSFNQLFLDTASGKYRTASDPGYRQASNAIPLEFGMVPAEYRASVLQGLVDDVRAHGDHLNTGILGTPALLDVLTQNGYADLAQAITDQTTYPSWGQWIGAGADTLWEQWGLNARSHNHPMFGTVDAWFYQDVAGISPDPQHPGYQHSIIKPYPMAVPSNASASYDSMYGQIKSAWTATATGFHLDATIPANATSTIFIPVRTCSTVTESGSPADAATGVESLGISNGYAEFNVGSGSYHFRCG
jgi:alpha-L-rhamnosidase